MSINKLIYKLRIESYFIYPFVLLGKLFARVYKMKTKHGLFLLYSNPDAAGARWFVIKVKTIQDPVTVMTGLDSLKIKDEAIVETILSNKNITNTTGDSIWLVRNNHDNTYYQSSNVANSFVVYSEV